MLYISLTKRQSKEIEQSLSNKEEVQFGTLFFVRKAPYKDKGLRLAIRTAQLKYKRADKYLKKYEKAS